MKTTRFGLFVAVFLTTIVASAQTGQVPQGGGVPSQQPSAPAIPGATGSVGQQGITVGEVKLFDERLLTTMLASLEMQLASLRTIDQAGVTAAIGRLQGAQITTSSVGLTATGRPTPKSTSESTSGSTGTTGSETTSTSPAGTTTTVTDGKGSTTTALVTDKAGSTTKETSGGTTSENTKATTETASIVPAIPAAPTGTSLYSTGPAVGLASQDILAEQMNLSYQILNLRMLLSRALSDRYLSQDIEWASGRRSGVQSVKGQAVLGFQIGIDAQKRYSDAVAEIEVTLPAGQWIGAHELAELEALKAARAKQGAAFSETDQSRLEQLSVDAALCHSSGATSLVSLLPREKTYNVATISRSASSFGFGAIVQVVNVGFTASRSKETMYLVKDTDTVALQGRSSPDGTISFGWQFRPVLGRSVVEPGLRQVFATVALPVPASCGFVGELRVKTRWREYDRKTGAIKGPKGVEETQVRPLAIPAFAVLEDSLRPKITALDWTDAGGGQIVAWATGEAFLDGTAVVLGNTRYGDGSPEFVKQGEVRWRLSLPAAKLALARDAYLVGAYGTPTAVRVPGVAVSTSPPSGPVLEIGDTRVTPSGADRSLVQIEIRSSSATPYMPSADKPPVVLIGSRVFGLSDAPCEMVRDKDLDGAPKPGTTTLSFKAATDLVSANDLVTVMEFFKGPDFSATATLNEADVFAPTRLDVLSSDDQNVRLGVVGAGFTDDAAVIAADREFSVKAGTLVRRNSTLLTFVVPLATAKSLKQVLVWQGNGRPKILPYPTTASPKPTVVTVGTITQGDSKWVTLAGANLASIRSVLYDGKTSLRFEPESTGASLKIFVTAEVTATAGVKQLELTNAGGDRVICELRVDASKSPHP